MIFEKQNLEAIIFDMDGVISDTQVLHSKTESELLKKYGVSIAPEEISRRFAGVNLSVIFETLFTEAGKPLPSLEMLIAEKWKKMDEVAHERVSEIPGTRTCILNLHKHEFKLAVASGSRSVFIQQIIKGLQLDPYFQAIASSEEVENGKPAPDVFLLAAKRLGVNPENCLVIEDGINGMLAAKRAGMCCIGLVPSELQHSELFPADVCVSDLSRLSIKKGMIEI